MSKFHVFACLVLASVAPLTFAQTTFEIDLAGPSEQTFEVPQGTYDIVLRHAIPRKVYAGSCSVEPALIDPLARLGTPAPSAGATDTPLPQGACKDLEQATDDLEAASDEGQVRQAVEEIGKFDTSCKATNVRDENLRAKIIAIKKRAKGLKDLTTVTFCEKVELDQGETIVVIATRPGGQGDLEQWRFSLAEPSGVWFMSYGFTFVEDRDERFFTRAVEDEMGVFDIVEKTDNQDLELVPTTLFHYMPRKWRRSAVSHSVVAGLGIDDSAPAVLLGYSLSFRTNVSLVLGLALHEQDRLDGRFSAENLRTTQDLDEDKLVESSYRPNAFFGVSFRFGKAPSTHTKSP